MPYSVRPAMAAAPGEPVAARRGAGAIGALFVAASRRADVLAALSAALIAGAAAALCCVPAAAADALAASADNPASIAGHPDYRLMSATPAVYPAPGLSSVASLGNRPEFIFTLPASFSFDSLPGALSEDSGNVLERPRATVRYAWYSQPGWDLKIGLSTMLDSANVWQRYTTPVSDRLHLGGLPTMHLSGQSRLADRWLLSVSAEGLHTTRGQGLDMDLRIDYSLTRDVAIFGSYRITDSSGDGPEIYGFLPSNSARLGVRLRF
jgi:hypothetical protein